jgi:hypothetical protein
MRRSSVVPDRPDPTMKAGGADEREEESVILGDN